MSSSNAPYDAQASTNYKEAFALFDKRGNQRVQADSLGDLLRACGQNPTLQEIRELEKNVGNDCKPPKLQRLKQWREEGSCADYWDGIYSRF
jgi:Ca2+-binding EF-hand superfamily protein